MLERTIRRRRATKYGQRTSSSSRFNDQAERSSISSRFRDPDYDDRASRTISNHGGQDYSYGRCWLEPDPVRRLKSQNRRGYVREFHLTMGRHRSKFALLRRVSIDKKSIALVQWLGRCRSPHCSAMGQSFCQLSRQWDRTTVSPSRYRQLTLGLRVHPHALARSHRVPRPTDS